MTILTSILNNFPQDSFEVKKLKCRFKHLDGYFVIFFIISQSLFTLWLWKSKTGFCFVFFFFAASSNRQNYAHYKENKQKKRKILTNKSSNNSNNKNCCFFVNFLFETRKNKTQTKRWNNYILRKKSMMCVCISLFVEKMAIHVVKERE